MGEAMKTYEDRTWALMCPNGKIATATCMPHFYMPSWIIKRDLTEQEARALEQLFNSGETHGNR